MKKSIFEAMKCFVVGTLNDVPLDLLSVSDCESSNKETGEITRYTRFEVEVPRGFDALSRCRFAVKVPENIVNISDADLEAAEYSIRFFGLVVSYVDAKGTVYFRADNCILKKEEK